MSNLWKKGQSGNPKGRPRKTFSSLAADMKAKGITPLTKRGLLEMYALVFNSTEGELKDMAVDKATPYALRIIISELNKPKFKAQALADYRNYCFGKATERIDLDMTTAGQPITPDYSNLSVEMLEKLAALKSKPKGSI